ncbi:hypothetical protein GCM10017778_32300 [Streptomyces vinaceus]|nr:hypothetical protein [Streptomyces vinaceus]GHE46027.1 hypothetical protein GCM10017778_32300 [Streptomyces vinaceus]
MDRPRSRRAERPYQRGDRFGHDLNRAWHPPAEEALWRPDLQQAKRSQNGSVNVRYRNLDKAAAVDSVRRLVASNAPWLRIRFAF